MDWSQRRKISYAVGFAVIIILLVSYPAYLFFYKAPTCFDSRQNGAETGVDCGGGCALVCAVDVRAPRVVWAKAFSLGDDHYDLGAYLENPNTKAGVKEARYTFMAYGASGSIIVEKKGTTEIPPGSGFVLFEPNVVVTESPNRVEVVFESEDLTRWIKASVNSSLLSTKNQSLKNTDTKPRYDAVLVNNDPVNSVSDLVLSAIVYNGARNPVAISQTYVNIIPKAGEQNIFFTWPNRFNGTSENFIADILITPHLIFVED